MLKFLPILLGLLVANCSAVPQFADESEDGPNVHMAAGPAFMTEHGYAARGCPPGTHPGGRLGCAGDEITDRAQISEFDRPIATGCHGLPQTRTLVKEGISPSGRPVRFVIRQHKECR